MKRVYHAALVLLVPSLFSCERFVKKEKQVKMRDVQEFYTYQHLTEAPEKIVEASKAVVKIEIGGASGTGFFISEDGLLATNNHVIGIDNCSRAGCYAEIFEDFQKGSYYKKRKYYLEPRYVDPVLDITVHQVRDWKNGSKLLNQSHLTIKEESSRDLIEQQVYFIGHPKGGLKKWTDTTVYQSDGDIFYTSNLCIGGSSGSPFVNEDGEVIGILHSGNMGGEASRHGYKSYTIGTASKAFSDKANAVLDGELSLTEGSLALLEEVEDNPMVTGYNIRQLSTVYFTSDLSEPKNEAGEPLFLREFARNCDDYLAQGTVRNRLDFSGPAYYCAVGPNGWFNRFLARDLKDGWIKRLESYVEQTHQSHAAVSLGSYETLFSLASQMGSEYNGKSPALAKINEHKPVLDFRLASILITLGETDYEGVNLGS